MKYSNLNCVFFKEKTTLFPNRFRARISMLIIRFARNSTYTSCIFMLLFLVVCSINNVYPVYISCIVSRRSKLAAHCFCCVILYISIMGVTLMKIFLSLSYLRMSQVSYATIIFLYRVILRCSHVMNPTP